jgi:hypothetical protein
MKRYKFLRTGLKSNQGNCKWKVGKWKKFDGDLEMCQQGFHCSKTKYQAFSYVQGEILAEVEVKGKNKKQKDKEVWSEMMIVKCWKWQKKDSVALAIFSAEQCLKNFEKEYPDDKRPREAIEAAKRWLEHPTKKNQVAARSEAWSAAESAWSAWSAAESAAWSAWSAESAAWSAWSAESAAWSEAWSEAWSAAWSAARSAAESAWSAARSAAIRKIEKWIKERELEVI